MKYIVEGFATDELNEKINNSPAKRLILEMNFKFGMKVLALEDQHPLMRRPIDSFYMTDSSGAFTLGKVWVDKEDGDDVYNYRTPYYRKERGSDSADRETIHSKKLSTLMATFKRQGVVPNFDDIFYKHAENFSQAQNSLGGKYGSLYKNNQLDVEDIHDLLRHVVLGESPNTLDIEKCKTLLDKYNQIDMMKVQKEQDIQRFFSEFYALGADELNTLVIGKVKRLESDKFSVVEPFVRVKDLSQHEHLQPIMLMQKVVNEDKLSNAKWFANLVPQTSGYLDSLDIVQVCTRHVSPYFYQWTLIPCSNI